jgi:hypothetical protein
MDTNAGASLDLSAAAFAQLAPLSQGVIRGASISVAGAPTKKASSGGKRTTSKHGGGITSIKNPKNQHASNKFAAPGVTTAGIHIPNPLPGIGAAGSFLTSLGDPHTWVRIGEVIGGAILAIFALLVIWQVFKGNDNPVSGAVSSVKSAGMKAGLVAAAA